MAYGRKIRGGDVILPTIIEYSSGSSASVYKRRRKRVRKKATTHRKRRVRKSKTYPHSAKRKRRKSYGRRKATRRRTTRKAGKTYRTKRGQPYIILANGRAKFIKRRR